MLVTAQLCITTNTTGMGQGGNDGYGAFNYYSAAAACVDTSTYLHSLMHLDIRMTGFLYADCISIRFNVHLRNIPRFNERI